MTGKRKKAKRARGRVSGPVYPPARPGSIADRLAKKHGGPRYTLEGVFALLNEAIPLVTEFMINGDGVIEVLFFGEDGEDSSQPVTEEMWQVMTEEHKAWLKASAQERAGHLSWLTDLCARATGTESGLLLSKKLLAIADEPG